MMNEYLAGEESITKSETGARTLGTMKGYENISIYPKISGSHFSYCSRF